MFWWLQRRLIVWEVERSIRKHGWSGPYVPSDDEFGALSYSVGFQDSLGAPEVIMFGANLEYANGVLHLVYNALGKGELAQVDEGVWDAPWGPAPKVAWKRVHRSQIRREHFNLAIIHAERVGRRREDIEAWQLVFADTDGHLPWEAEFNSNYVPKQHALWQPYSGPPDED